MFSVNFVTYTFCKHSFCNDSLENVVGIDAFPDQLSNKEYLVRILKAVRRVTS